MDEQTEDMRNCMTSDSVIGIDRTFNKGPCFLTALVYQNLNFVITGTLTSPMVLGPIFLHWDAHYPTYCDFLAKLCSANGFNVLSIYLFLVLFLVKAIKTVFPNSQHISCTRHLKENCW